jgi:hypothetical protein
MATTGIPAGRIDLGSIATLEMVFEFTTLQPGLGQQALTSTVLAGLKPF